MFENIIIRVVFMAKDLLFVASLIFLSTLSGCAEKNSVYEARIPNVTANSPSGTYEISGGPIVISIIAPGIINANITSPNLSVIGSLLGISTNYNGTSGQAANFGMNISLSGISLDLGGKWATTIGNKFIVDLDMNSLISQIQSLGGTATVTKKIITGSVLSNGDISGAFDIGIKLSLNGKNIAIRVSSKKYLAKPVNIQLSPMMKSSQDIGNSKDLGAYISGVIVRALKEVRNNVPVQ